MVCLLNNRTHYPKRQFCDIRNGFIHNMHIINKKKKFDQKEKFTTTNLNKIGHFYFGLTIT